MDNEFRLIGKSPHLKDLLNFIKKVAKVNENVLILGETGVGKELAARLIHLYSERKNKPFIKLNSANLNENLLESELFGHKKGSFTGAVIDKPGLIEEANGGTFFLDEIADITPSLQAKLLSLIEDKDLRRLGENTSRKIDVRFILATNKDIYEFIKKGKFRKDLYYRISILTFYILPIRERKEDILSLVEYYIERMSLKQGRSLSVSKEAIDKLINYSFPGNVRELENIIKRAVFLAQGNLLKERDISFSKRLEEGALRKNCFYSIEKIVNVLVKYKGNKTLAARDLGISRRHLYRLLNK